MPRLRRSARRGAGAALTALVAVALLAGCRPTVALEPAPDANNPLCAGVIVSLPDAIGDQERRWTDAQATGAWGTPDTSVILTCGVPVPAPTADLPCSTLGGVDWLVDDSDFDIEAPAVRVTSYGRDPAVQVYVRTDRISANTALAALGPKLSGIPATRACTSPATLEE